MELNRLTRTDHEEEMLMNNKHTADTGYQFGICQEA